MNCTHENTSHLTKAWNLLLSYLWLSCRIELFSLKRLKCKDRREHLDRTLMWLHSASVNTSLNKRKLENRAFFSAEMGRIVVSLSTFAWATVVLQSHRNLRFSNFQINLVEQWRYFITISVILSEHASESKNKPGWSFYGRSCYLKCF